MQLTKRLVVNTDVMESREEGGSIAGVDAALLREVVAGNGDVGLSAMHDNMGIAAYSRTLCEHSCFTQVWVLGFEA